LIIFGLPAVLASVAQTPARFEFTEVHMGLPVRIVLYAEDEPAARVAGAAAFDRIGALDTVLSDYRPDSELNGLSATSDRWVPVSDGLYAVLIQARWIARATGGAFDPTVGPLVSLWREARRVVRLPDAEALADARRNVGWPHLSFDPERQAVRLARSGMQLDLGGIAKGFVLQDALEVLRGHGVATALVEAGGDVVVGDAPPGRPGWRIDVPGADPTFAARAARLTNGALATSGGSRQFVEIDGVRYSHVVDPATGLGLTHDLVAHVIARDGATADALATALGVAGPDRTAAILSAFPDVMAIIVPGQPTNGPTGLGHPIGGSGKSW
jgi:thiamine biosynthesis lipoprotein